MTAESLLPLGAHELSEELRFISQQVKVRHPLGPYREMRQALPLGERLAWACCDLPGHSEGRTRMESTLHLWSRIALNKDVQTHQPLAEAETLGTDTFGEEEADAHQN